MIERDWAPTIKVAGAKSKKKYEDAVALDDVAGRAFVDRICGLLDTLDSKPSGHALLDEIKATGKQVTIFLDDASGSGSAALPYPGTATNEYSRFVKLRQIPQAALTALRRADAAFISPTMQGYAALFHATVEHAIGRVGRDEANRARNQAAVILGITRDEFDQIEAGAAPLKPEAYHRFAMYYYDHLVPGDGCTVGLRFDPTQAGVKDPELIILGHEMVHVWRMVKGMRIFEGGWEEEAMTTGLPPFTNMKFSENKLRAEHDVDMRTAYNARCGTAHYNNVTVFNGVWPEHVRVWEAWKADHPNDWNNPVTVHSGSVISAPQRNLYNR